MNYAIVIDGAIVDDAEARNKLIGTLRHTRGILQLDDEMAENGLLLAQIDKNVDLDKIRAIPGVEALDTMGVKHAI